MSLILPAEIAWLMLKFQFIDFSDLCVHKGKLLLSELFNILFWAACTLVSDVGKIDSSEVERILTFV